LIYLARPAEPPPLSLRHQFHPKKSLTVARRAGDPNRLVIGPSDQGLSGPLRRQRSARLPQMKARRLIFIGSREKRRGNPPGCLLSVGAELVLHQSWDRETGCGIDDCYVLGKEIVMSLNGLEDLFVEELNDLYDAEKKITKALPKMVKAASS